MYLLFWAEAIIYWSEVPRQVHRVEKVIAQKKKKIGQPSFYALQNG